MELYKLIAANSYCVAGGNKITTGARSVGYRPSVELKNSFKVKRQKLFSSPSPNSLGNEETASRVPSMLVE